MSHGEIRDPVNKYDYSVKKMCFTLPLQNIVSHRMYTRVKANNK